MEEKQERAGENQGETGKEEDGAQHTGGGLEAEDRNPDRERVSSDGTDTVATQHKEDAARYTPVNEKETKTGSAGKNDDGGEQREPRVNWKKARTIIMPSMFLRISWSTRALNDTQSKACSSAEFQLPRKKQLLALSHCLGYDSMRRGNMSILDVGVFLIVAGAYLRIVDTKRDSKNHYLRTSGPGSFACIAVHPSRKIFAAGECCKKPNITIFDYPSCRLVKLLSDGTENTYQCMTFSPDDGDMLASQGGEPDYLLTVWDWKCEVPILKSKNVPHPIYYVSFSKFLEGRLVTHGAVNVRFWTISKTFTGLKLTSEPGKFGSIALSDIEGCEMLPDGQAISGSEWGNMFVWDEGLIRAEMTRDRDRPLHEGRIVQVLLHEGELYTVGEEGTVVMWRYDNIRDVDPPQWGHKCVTRPVFSLSLGKDVKLMHMEPMHPDALLAPMNEECLWYMQDGAGCIWQIDLSFSSRAHQPKKLLQSHGGPVLACATSTVSHLVATAGTDKTVRIYDCLQNRELACLALNVAVSTLEWVPKAIDKIGASLVGGSLDGSVKKIVFRCASGDTQANKKKPEVEISLSQTFKAHTQVVTSIAFSPDMLFLATSSADASVFLYTFNKCNLEPCCWFTVSNWINYLQWTPQTFSYRGLLLACRDSVVTELNIPIPYKVSLTHTLQAKNFVYRTFVMRSVKSLLQHREVQYLKLKQQLHEAREIRRRYLLNGMITAEEAEQANLEDDRKLQNPNFEVEDETDWFGRKEKWKPYHPPVPSHVIKAMYDVNSEGGVWLVLSDYDSGYLYHCRLPDVWLTHGEELPEDLYVVPDKSPHVPFLKDQQMTMLKFLCSGTLAGVGLKDGRFVMIQLKERYDLSYLGAYWYINVHDTLHGGITGLEMAFDQSFVVTTGMDGNIFVFSYKGKLQRVIHKYAFLPMNWDHHTLCTVDLDEEAETIREALDKKMMQERRGSAETAKQKSRTILNKVKKQLAQVLRCNATLPPHVQISRNELLVNIKIKEEAASRTAEAVTSAISTYQWISQKTSIGVKKLLDAYKPDERSDQFVLRGFYNNHNVHSYRIPTSALGSIFTTEKIWRDSSTDVFGITEKDSTQEQPPPKPSRSDELFEQMYDGFHRGFFVGSTARRLHYSLEFVKRSRDRRAVRRAEWDRFMKEQPLPDADDPRDMAAIEEAKDTVGVKVLREDQCIAENIRVSRSVKSGQRLLATLERQIKDKMQAFNKRLERLRQDKCTIIEITKKMRQKLIEEDEIVVEKELCLPAMGVVDHKYLPDVPLLEQDEVPESRFAFDTHDLMHFRRLMMLCRRDESDAERDHKQGRDLNASHSIYLEGYPEAFTEKRISMKPVSSHVYYMGEARPPPSEVITFFQQRVMNSVPCETITEKKPTDKHLLSVPVRESRSLSPLQLEILEVHRFTMVHRANSIKHLVNNMTQAFDCHLYALYRSKVRLDVLLKRAELFYITRLEEFLINRDARIEEAGLQENARKADANVNKLKATKERLTGRIADLTRELGHLNENSTSLFYLFQDTVREQTTRRRNFLSRVFRKRVKVHKPKSESDSESESSSDDDDEEESGSDGEDSDHWVGHEVLDECPPDINPETFQYVWQLRGRRQELDERIVGVKLETDRCKKELERLAPQAETLEKVAKETRCALLQFLVNVQQQWNQLDVPVPLHVFQFSRENSLDIFTPEHVVQSIVLEAADLNALIKRVPGLHREIKEQKLKFRQDAVALANLKQTNANMAHELMLLERKCEDEMRKKFGRVVSLQQLELAMVNPQLESLQARFLQENGQHCDKLDWYKASILNMKLKLAEMIRETSSMYFFKAEALERALKIERRVEKKRKTKATVKLGIGPTGWDIARQRDLKTLKTLVAQQADEIARHRREITALHAKVLPDDMPRSLTSASRRSLLNLDGRSSWRGYAHLL